jgi:glucan biosynthesis protein
VIVEERDYLLVPGGAARYLEVWHRLGRYPQVRHLGEPIGVYTVDIGQLNTIVYLWQYADIGDRSRRRGRLAADVGFAQFRKQVRDLVVTQSNRLLVPSDLPPLNG